MPTAQTLVDNALKKAGVYAASETPETADRTQCLAEMNLIVGTWQAQRRFGYYTRIDVFTITTSASSYTIGPSGSSPSFSLGATGIRPIEILGANLIRVGDTPDTRVPLQVFNVDDYRGINEYLQTAEEPAALFYNPTFPNGTLYPVPYPEDTTAAKANKLELYSKFLLASFADINTTSYDLPPGYENALTLTLAEVVAPLFGKTLPQEVKDQARQARAAIRSNNSKPPKLVTDSGLTFGR